VVPALAGAGGDVGATSDARPCVAVTAPSYAVRRLTPRECERLQGFPDDYTLIEFRGKPASDGARYRALGNSMATSYRAF
jgi:DNA (cytosine-5)-methyltransferase 1